ncbi:DsbA family protein [Labrys monachus]|uniref:Protein-disulfide isomerase n=1 Tax=Labrys monachus TaxID=217067 RepID=A0ABU0FI90_9HYPH|nr:DsbA family protein [Labrys monachus]MDQ0393795.1 protein-disulfide isomerase [Labrys monachus]
MSTLSQPVGPRDHAQGPADAAVTLVEYGDFECPYCGETVGVIDAVRDLMGDRLRYVFRHFPVTRLHPHAHRAAEFSEAADDIGRFWPMHRILYDNQERLDDRSLRAYGRRLGLSEAAMADAFNDRFADRIEADFRSGIDSGVNATPTLFVNGQRYDGRRDVRGLHAALLAAAGL